MTFITLRELLKRKYPGIKVIPYTEMPKHHLMENPGVSNVESEAFITALKEKDCDAVTSGNAS